MGLAQIARVRKWPNTQDGRFLKTCLSFSPLTVPEHRCGPCGRAGEHLSVAGTGRLARLPQLWGREYANPLIFHNRTSKGRHLVLPRHTRPNKEHELLLHQLGMTLPQQPTPRICA